MNRLRGLKDLVQDAVEEGSAAVEKIHRGTADKTFGVLEMIPPVALPAKIVHLAHNVVLSTVYGSIRVVNRIAGATAGVVIDVVDRNEPGGKQPRSPD